METSRLLIDPIGLLSASNLLESKNELPRLVAFLAANATRKKSTLCMAI